MLMAQREKLLLVICCIPVELIKCVPVVGLPILIDKHEMRISISFKDIIIVACDSWFIKQEIGCSHPDGKDHIY